MNLKKFKEVPFILGIISCIANIVFLWLILISPDSAISSIKGIKTEPITITKIVTEFKAIRRPSLEVPNSQSTSPLMSGELEIKTNPIEIMEGQDGKIYISDTVTGNARMGSVQWDIALSLQSKEVYRKPIIPLTIGVMVDHHINADVGIALPIPFVSEFDLMVGIKESNIARVFKLSRYSAFRVGVGYNYSSSQPVGVVGIEAKVF